MDALKDVREIGFFETGLNLAGVLSSHNIWDKVGAVMPLPDPNLSETLEKMADCLDALGKQKYMFFTPEIALIDKLAERDSTKEAIILLPSELEEESRDIIAGNCPKNMQVHLLQDPFFPRNFYPSNGVLVVVGYTAGEKLIVLPETYRMMKYYINHFGKKVFLPYAELEEPIRYDGWLEVDSDKFNVIWRGDKENE